MGRNANFFNVLIVFLLSVAISFIRLLTTFPVAVDGGSMIPTFYGGDIIYANTFDARFEEIKRGDVVVFLLPGENDGALYLKRVIGLPGEKISIGNARVYVNGEELYEPYLRNGGKTVSEEAGVSYDVPAGSYFVMGDNRESSVDSRNFVLSYIKADDIVAKFYYLNFP